MSILQDIRSRSDRWSSQTRGKIPIRDLKPSNAGQASWDRAWLLELFDDVLAGRVRRDEAVSSRGQLGQ